MLDDIEQHICNSDWYGHVGNDFYLIDNPHFLIDKSYPYKSEAIIGMYCRSGRAEGSINLQHYEITAGSFIIILPGQILTFGGASSDYRSTNIIFSNEFFNDFKVDGELFLRSYILQNPRFEASQGFIESIELYLSVCRRVIKAEHNNHRLEILLHVTKAFFLGIGQDLHPVHDGVASPTLFREFAAMVESGYRQHRDVRYYADRLCRTEKHVSAVVRAATGMSALDWIERYVILDAKSQLASTDRTIKQIANDLSFADLSAFSKYFTRVVGLSPTAYRKSVLLNVH